MCLSGIPVPLANLDYAKVVEQMDLSVKGLNALKSYLVTLFGQARHDQLTTLSNVDFGAAINIINLQSGWVGDSGKQWNHLGWVVFSLIQTGHVHVLFAMALWTLCSQANVEQQQNPPGWPSCLKECWGVVLRNVPQAYQNMSNLLRNSFVDMDDHFISRLDEDDDGSGPGPGEGPGGGRLPPPPPHASHPPGGPSSSTHGQAGAAPGGSTGSSGFGDGSGGHPPAPPGASASVSLTANTRKKKKKKRGMDWDWESHPTYKSKERKVETALSVKGSTAPSHVRVLSEFLKAPAESISPITMPFQDPGNPLVSVNIKFARKWDRPQDLWPPDLDHVYVDTRLKLVIRPDDTVFQGGESEFIALGSSAMFPSRGTR